MTVAVPEPMTMEQAFQQRTINNMLKRSAQVVQS